ncbi:MAG: tRNA guanosine(34) transglycosylase Tgt [Thermoplasmatales archaeon]|nr:tRNA guanosine(34) transglycosylase Tgt [Thermoplasmatales archaeon]
MFRIVEENGMARIGLIKVGSNTLETPAFLPVATKGAIKTLTPEEAKEAGCKAIIVNSLHIYRRAFEIVCEKGIHSFMKWDGIIFTDSGGFQSIKKFPSRTIDEGIIFSMPDGSKEIFTPEKCIEIQKKMGSDFIFMLDDCPSYPYSKKRVEKSVERTISWAKRSYGENVFSIVQGGIHEDLRERCAKELAKMDFYGYAIGGLCIGEEKKDMIRTVEFTTRYLPYEKARHLMGVGAPEDIEACVRYGIDIFDSAFPTRNARHGTIFTSKGKLTLGKKKIRGDEIDENCNCYTCRNFSLDYLNYLFMENEMLAQRLATIHNIYLMNKFMENLREKIKEGKI